MAAQGPRAEQRMQASFCQQARKKHEKQPFAVWVCVHAAPLHGLSAQTSTVQETPISQSQDLLLSALVLIDRQAEVGGQGST